MNSPPERAIFITGPTATGKSRLALDLAHALQDRGLKPLIVSADSVQVYRYMDIGSDKLPPDRREGVPHFLIDVVNPDETFSAAQFRDEAQKLIDSTKGGDRAAILVGGTGFYLRALLRGLFPGPARDPELRERLYRQAEEIGLQALHERLRGIDPEAALRIHPNDPVRIVRALEVFELTGRPLSAHFKSHRKTGPRPRIIIGLDRERSLLFDRINRRVSQMIEQGLIEEVKKLRDMGYGPGLASQRALGYRQVHRVLDGEIEPAAAVEIIQRDTRHYARRQLTWLRKEPELKWMPADKKDEIVQACLRSLEEDS